MAAGLLASINVVAMAARIGWGLLSDRRFGGRRKPVLLIIILLTLAGILGAAFLPPEAPVVLVGGLVVVLGASSFAWTGIVGTLAIENAGRESAGTALALVQVIGNPAALLGPPLFGLLADRTGTYRVAWLIVAGVVALGLVGWRRVTERPPQTLPSAP